MRKTETKFKIFFITINLFFIGASAALAGTATLTWNANTEPDLAGYKIYYGTSPRTCGNPGLNGATMCGYTSSLSVGNVLTHTFNSLTNGLTYYFSVSAYDTSNNYSLFSGEVSKIIPPLADTTPPTLSAGAPTGSQPAGTTQVTMTVTTNENATCKYSTSANTAYASMASTFTTTGTTNHSTIVTGLTNGNTYNRYIRCQDTAGNVNTSDYAVTFSVASAGSATFVVGSRVQVAPTTSVVNVRATPSVGGVLLGTQAAGLLGTVIGGPTSADGYTWWQINYDTGADGWSAEEGFLILYVPPAGDTTPPTIPSGLLATAVSSSQINLTWTASADAVGVTGYRIYRCAGSGCTSMTEIATSVTNSYSNTGLTASILYRYSVSAYDAAGNGSGQSLTAQATTQAAQVIICNNFNYSDWGVCQSNSTQSRTVSTAYPAGCSGGSPVLTQFCVYTPPGGGGGGGSLLPPTCTAFTYAAWSACQPNGVQIRTYSASPAGCIGGNPTTTQACAVGQITYPSLPPTTIKYNFATNLVVGSRSQDVINLQAILKAEGLFNYPSTTNYFGNVTKQAVIGFQKKYNLSPAVGYVGSLTRAKLNQLYGGGTVAASLPPTVAGSLVGPLGVGMKSDQVKILQTYLAKDSSIYPEGAIDGRYGPSVVKAVERFQCKYLSICAGNPNVNGYGLAGPNTRAKIIEVLK